MRKIHKKILLIVLELLADNEPISRRAIAARGKLGRKSIYLAIKNRYLIENEINQTQHKG